MKSGRPTCDIEMHAQARGTEWVPFSFEPTTRIYDVFPTVLCAEKRIQICPVEENRELTVLSPASTSL